MTIIVSMGTRDGIALSSDTRKTGLHSDQRGNQRVTIVTDTAQKLFLLGEHTVVGFAGEHPPGGTSLGQVFDRCDWPAGEPHQVADRLVAALRVAGVGRSSVILAGRNPAGLLYQVSANFVPDDDRVEFDNKPVLVIGEPEVPCVLAAQGLRFPLHAMTLRDGMEASRFLVWTTMEMQRFQAEAQTVGGEIDTVVIPIQGPPRWISNARELVARDPGPPAVEWHEP